MLSDLTFDISTQAVPGTDKGSNTSAALLAEIEQFLFREARLLDTRHFEGWLELFTPEGMYWVPHEPTQQSAHDHISLFWEDATLREVRVRRITNARNWSQQPITRTARIVGNVLLDGTDADGRLIVHSTLHLTEWRIGQRHLAALVSHKLEQTEQGWKIYLKRVDLVNSTDAFANLEIFV